MQYSAIWRRATAAIIDTIILSVISGICIRSFFLFPLGFFIHIFYKPIFESSRVRATPGKYLAEISVVKENGDQLDLKTAYVRYFSSWLSGATLGLGYAFSLFNSKRQTLHDMLAGTIVIDRVYDNDGLWNEWVNQMRFFLSSMKNKYNQ